ncbi:MAG: DNA repair protein RecN, partial [Bacteroidota bacterium]
MLRSLYVKDYALIEELEVTFDSGLNIITGETGAGKSILMGALSMILGDRASTDRLREGAKKAIIEGIFDEADTPRIRALLTEHTIDTEPLPRIILRRQLTEYGSRGFINDTPATLDVMRGVAAELIDLHGQHEHQSLLNVETHRAMIDSFGGLSGLIEQYEAYYDEVDALLQERTEMAERKRELSQQRELYEFQIQEIDEVDPQPGEEDDLKAERRVLENAEHLYASTSRLYDMLYTDEHAVHDKIVVARNTLQDLARIDQTFEEQLDEIKSVQIVVSELASFLQDYNAHVEFDPDRLQRIRERIAELERLKRKYGGTLQAVLEHRKEIGEKYALANDFSGALERLTEQINDARARLSDAAQRLSDKRREVAERVEDAVERELEALGMPDSQFEVRFERTADSDGWITINGTGYRAFRHGLDQVAFYISTNVGVDP